VKVSKLQRKQLGKQELELFLGKVYVQLLKERVRKSADE
jgi:hypothetical protein